MSVSFPAVSPTRRSFTPGRYATKKFDSISGSSSIRLYGSRAFDAELTMDFVTGDAETTAILNSWHESKGGAYTLTLPASIFTGTTSDLTDQIPSYLNWRWAESPSVESLFPGRSRVQVRLVATLDA
jgi:hypothetical protein